jgi:hypothetical protein
MTDTRTGSSGWKNGLSITERTAQSLVDTCCLVSGYKGVWILAFMERGVYDTPKGAVYCYRIVILLITRMNTIRRMCVC